MRNAYIEESYVANKLREMYPDAEVKERGKSNCFAEDILVIYPDGKQEKYEVKEIKFRSSEQSLLYINGKYIPFDGSKPGRYTQSILGYLEKNNIVVKDTGIRIPVNIDTAKGYLKEQLLRRGNDKVVFADSLRDLMAIFDLHDENFVPDIESAEFTLRNKPSGTKRVIPETASANECKEMLRKRFVGCEIVEEPSRLFVKIKGTWGSRIELSKEYIAAPRDNGMYEIRKRGQSSVINLTPVIKMNENMFR